MRIAITGRHSSVTDAMKTYATDKFSKLERHNDLVTTAEVVMDVGKDRHMVEMIAHTKVGGRMVGKAEHSDMYAAIDLLLDKMERQLTKQKEKVKTERKHSGRAKEAAGSGTEGLRPADWPDFVLAPFLPEEREVLGRVLGRAADCAQAWLDGADLNQLMGTYNGFGADESRPDQPQ